MFWIIGYGPWVSQKVHLVPYFQSHLHTADHVLSAHLYNWPKTDVGNDHQQTLCFYIDTVACFTLQVLAYRCGTQGLSSVEL